VTIWLSVEHFGVEHAVRIGCDQRRKSNEPTTVIAENRKVEIFDRKTGKTVQIWGTQYLGPVSRTCTGGNGNDCVIARRNGLITSQPADQLDIIWTFHLRIGHKT
jgi:hypothetical protein